ncbi:MAG: hypothetical protein JXR89_03495 [Deltaproteobacteria bacterium]|nr:hypothetical protein [Deltaproteobacteria bacterium]
MLKIRPSEKIKHFTIKIKINYFQHVTNVKDYVAGGGYSFFFQKAAAPALLTSTAGKKQKMHKKQTAVSRRLCFLVEKVQLSNNVSFFNQASIITRES